MTILNLEDEREARETTEIADLESALQSVSQQIEALGDATDTTILAKKDRLLSRRAAYAKRLKIALSKEQDARLTAEADAEMDALSMGDLAEGVKAELRFWLKGNSYYYTHNDNTYWLHSPGSSEPWSAHSRSSLVNHNPKLDTRSPVMRYFTEVLQEDGRWFRTHTRTFEQVGSDTLNMLRWQFLQPEEGEHHWVFDTLMCSLGGGKAENIEHIEKVIVAKWANPANYTLPTVVISDDGGTGKSLFAEKVLPIIFGSDLVSPNVAMEEVTGQFNAHLMGQAVWVINENRPDRNDQDGIKRILGSKTIRSERKGKDAQRAANTALVLVFGNFTLGAIKLSGTEVDRRFSILKNDAPLKTYTSQILNISPDEAHRWMWEEGQHVLGDPHEIAKWLGHLIVKHSAQPSVMALHGKDYEEMLEGQADTAQQVFKAFFTSAAFCKDGYFKQNTMFAFYSDYCRQHGIKTMSNQRFYSEAEAWLKRKSLAYERLPNKANPSPRAYGCSTAAVFVNPSVNPQGTLKANDHLFGNMDGAGINTWSIEID